MKTRVTLADIAKKAGVHVTTVSLALRNSPSLPLSTRERLRALAQEMGYHPDPALQSLVAYRHQSRPKKDIGTIAYLTHWGTKWGWKKSPAHLQFFTGAERKAQQLGYALEHFWMEEPALSHQRLSEILFSRGIQAIVIASHRYDLDAQLKFDWSHFSAVKLDYFPHNPALHTITNDQRAIIQLAIRRSVAAGYRRIGFVMQYRWDRGADLAWSAGFLAEQQQIRKSDQIPIFFFNETESFESGSLADHPAPQAEFETWFKRYEPEVVISYGPFVRPCLDRMGLAVPRDVAFVDLFLTDETHTTAGVRQNCERVGEVAVEILAGQLQQHNFGIPTFPTATLVEGTWIEGATLPDRNS